MPEPFKAHAAQDCGKVDAAGMTPGTRGDGVKVYPGIDVTQAASRGLMTAATAMEKFGTKLIQKDPTRPAGYRNAWDDCGGVGASSTQRMRTIAATIKGFAKPVPFKRNAAQDCDLDMGAHGTNPGPGNGIVYPR